jgi:two-component system, NtrC family, response regulator HydG
MTPAVLVVDDEADFLTTYDRLLRRQGYRTVTASSRQAALVALEGDPFALIIADIRLPDGDGLDVVRAARTRLRPPPVIVVTGFASSQSRRDALAAGATAYLPKPFSTAALTSLIRDTLATPASQ